MNLRFALPLLLSLLLLVACDANPDVYDVTVSRHSIGVAVNKNTLDSSSHDRSLRVGDLVHVWLRGRWAPGRVIKVRGEVFRFKLTDAELSFERGDSGSPVVVGYVIGRDK